MKFSSLCLACLGPLLASACLLPEEREGLPRNVGPSKRQAGNGVPIATGDRFAGGTIAPRGLGTQASSTTLTSILSVAEINSGLRALANVYGISTFTAPFTTFNGATVAGGKVGGNGTCNNAFRVYLNAGIHARERGGPDGLLFFVGDLLYANRNNVGLTYGRKTYTNAQVKRALSSGLVFVPLSNPDGVLHDQQTNSCWRKNRNTRSATGTRGVGVDLNRNFDFVWDFEEKFAPSAQDVASTNPAAETFHGLAPFSEPETKNIKWVQDTFSAVRWFIDLHSFAGDVLYSWGSDTNQLSFPAQNFLNAAYDNVRGDLSDTPGVGGGYGEYLPTAENAANIEAGRRMGNAMSTANGRTYAVIPAADLYPTSGASDDYAYSRHFADPSKNLIHSYTLEFGFGNNAVACPFYPTQVQHNQNIREIGAAFMEMLLAAVDIGLGGPLSC